MASTAASVCFAVGHPRGPGAKDRHTDVSREVDSAGSALAVGLITDSAKARTPGAIHRPRRMDRGPDELRGVVACMASILHTLVSDGVPSERAITSPAQPSR